MLFCNHYVSLKCESNKGHQVCAQELVRGLDVHVVQKSGVPIASPTQQHALSWLTMASYSPCRSFSPLVAPIKHTDSLTGLAGSRQGSFLGGRTQSVTGLAPGGLLNISRSAQSCTTASFDAWRSGSNLSLCPASQAAAAGAAGAQHDVHSSLSSVSGHRLSSMVGRLGEDAAEQRHSAVEPQLPREPALQRQVNNAGSRGHHQQLEWPATAAEGVAAGGGEVHYVEAAAADVSRTTTWCTASTGGTGVLCCLLHAFSSVDCKPLVSLLSHDAQT